MYEVVEAASIAEAVVIIVGRGNDSRLVRVTRRGIRVHAGQRWASRVDGQKRTPFGMAQSQTPSAH